MAWSAVHLLVILLAFFHLLASNTIAMPRTEYIFHKSQKLGASKNMKQKISNEATADDESRKGGMDFQLNDYTPTEANPYHTPRPPRV
ncbi:hypothetical protein Nepgr_029409 [Nepenthes gracilis]|uniref:Uncharacterized protein n=1 Tax=Nepenthes gracilis TaxID=150966 RepID=A0AAD3TE44_NEPGR|nr:hypothetical protein Nepgr_029409 [Nepenthes gracilis]